MLARWGLLLACLACVLAFLALVVARMPTVAILGAGLAGMVAAGVAMAARRAPSGVRWASIGIAGLTVLIVVGALAGLRPGGRLAPAGEGRLVAVASGIDVSVVVTPSVPTSDEQRAEDASAETVDVLLVVINTSDASVDVGAAELAVYFEGEQAERVGISGADSAEIPAGSSQETTFRYAVPADQAKSLDIEVLVPASDRFPTPYHFAPR